MKNKENEPREKPKVKLDFKNDKFLVRWLEGRPRKTRETYRYAMKRYALYTGLSPKEMLLEKQEDMKKPPMEQGIAESRLKGFFDWLTTEYISKRTGNPMAETSAQTYAGAIADFYGTFKVSLAVNWKDFKATPKAVNATEKMSAEQVEKLAYYAPTLRDKAIVWCMFQSGVDVSTVLSWNWGHVEKEIEKPPMGAVMIRDLERSKEKTTFNTLIYKTAVKHLREYLIERCGKNYAKKLKFDEPLFLGRSGGRHDSMYVQMMMRDIAPLADIANSRFEHADINPLRPHSLRASFEDQMAKVGTSPILIDYLMGHKVPFKGAYFGGEEGLRKAYVEYAEKALEPRGISSEEGLTLKKTVDGLSRMYEEEKQRREQLEAELAETKKRLKQYEPLTADGGIDTLTTVINAFQGVKTTEDLMEHLFLAFSDMLGEKGEEIFMEAFKKKKA